MAKKQNIVFHERRRFWRTSMGRFRDKVYDICICNEKRSGKCKGNISEDLRARMEGTIQETIHCLASFLPLPLSYYDRGSAALHGRITNTKAKDRLQERCNRCNLHWNPFFPWRKENKRWRETQAKRTSDLIVLLFASLSLRLNPQDGETRSPNTSSINKERGICIARKSRVSVTTPHSSTFESQSIRNTTTRQRGKERFWC